MWIAFALGSAFFAGLTAILAKIGIRHTPSNLATAIRTVVVLIFALLMVAIVGSGPSIQNLTGHTVLFLVLSGLSTGVSWLCFFRALQLGDVSRVAIVDRSSVVIAFFLAVAFLGETESLFTRLIGICSIVAGTYLMINGARQADTGPQQRSWFAYASGAAFFAALTSILGKVGIAEVESNLGTAIRTTVVLIMAWALVFISGEQREIRKIPRRDLKYILLSGAATGASWLCFYRALQEGPASVIIPLDKSSIIVTVAFAAYFLHEKISRRNLIGLGLIGLGTVIMLF